MELQGHMHEKMANFSVMSVGSLADFITQREADVNQKALAQAGQTPESMKVAVGELERQEWDLTKAKLDYDLNTLNVYKRRCSDIDSLSYHATREHQHRRHTNALIAAKKYVSSNCVFESASSVQAFQTVLSNIIKERATIHKIQESDVLTIPF